MVLTYRYLLISHHSSLIKISLIGNVDFVVDVSNEGEYEYGDPIQPDE